jgi:hypothetical protein
MKIEKSFELLNSEGPIIVIEKIDGYWHYKFNSSRGRTVTTIKEILNAIWNNVPIIDEQARKTYVLGNYPLSMKGDTPSYYEDIAEYLLKEELDKCKKNIDYFKNTYIQIWK